MENLAADFIIDFNNPIEAEFELADGGFDCSFELFATGTVWGSIDGILSNQTDLQAALDLKADKTELNTAVSELNTNIQNEATTRAENDTLLQNNINTLSATVTANYNTLDGKISDNSDNITLIQNTIDTYGDIVTYNAANFATSAQGALADSALQPNDNISELINDVGYITSSALPTVNDATLTIQKNSTDIDTFTANASVDKIVNIQVPVNASDVNALPDSTLYGASIDVSLNTTDYKLTITLKDQNGDTLNYKVVDFPIESVVVNGSYDNTNQKIILTLQNGNTIDIPVGALISGLQTEITSNNKLDADLVDDSTSTNKFVTTADKSTWNGKQDAISDLSTIRSNATNGQSAYTTIAGYGNIVTHNVSEFATSSQGALADTALQPNDNISELTNDVGYITSASLPIVNNGTLDIQVNGTSVGTFTANQAGNTTANIVVPDSATWGNITGTLSNQTDLQNALDVKYDASNPDGYITSADLPTNHVTTNTAQTISGDKKFTGVTRFQNGSGNGCVILGADVASTTVSPNTRKLGRMSFHTFENTVDCAFVSTDSEGIKNHVEFGGRIGDITNTSPDVLKFTVAKVHNSTANANKVNALEVSYSGGANFGVQPKYNNVNLATETYVNTGLATKQATLVSGSNIKTINGASILGSGNLTLDSLPSQTGQSGKFLTTDGTNASWQTVTIPTPTYDSVNERITW